MSWLLSQMLDSQHGQFNALADTWLSAGASAFGVWHQGQPVRLWPSQATTRLPDVQATLLLGDAELGHIGLLGLGGPEVAARLQADAAMLSRLAELEQELAIMTDDLIAAQDQQLALYDLTRSTRLHLDLDSTLRHVAGEATRLSGSPAGFIVLDLPGEPLRIVQHSPVSLDEGNLTACFRELQKSKPKEMLLNPEKGKDLPPGISNVFLRAIQIGNKPVAALGLLLNQPIDSISPYLKLARAIAEQAGAQIENVLLHQETVAQARLQTEMDLAREVQSRLLPSRSPQVPGLDVWGRSRPALKVGGDFFDFVEVPRGPLTLAVGDVAGKGMSAALVMAMIRTIIHNRARYLDSPKLVLDRSTEDLYEDFTELSAFATVFIANYDRHERTLRYANAGHSPVIFRPAAGPARLLEADAPPVGVLPESLSEDHQLVMQPGDLLVIATDGFSEAQSPNGDLFGYDRLLALVESVASLPAAQIGAALFDAAHSFSAGHDQDDDETLVVVKAV